MDPLYGALAVIDSHVHLYDTSRPGAVDIPPGYPELNRPILTPELRALGAPFGVQGAIVIEGSKNLDENRWLLEVAAADPYVVGVVGNLAAGSPDFEKRLAAYENEPRFCGIRVGTPWVPLDVRSERLIDDLRRLAAGGFTMDAVRVGGGNADLLRALIELGSRIPDLRIVIDHVPFDVPDAAARAEVRRLLGEFAARPHTYAKLSNLIPLSRTGAIPTDPGFYRWIVDDMLALYGPERLMYGSNWPVCALVAPYDRALRILIDDFATRDAQLAERFFSTNARAIYGLPV